MNKTKIIVSVFHPETQLAKDYKLTLKVQVNNEKGFAQYIQEVSAEKPLIELSEEEVS